MGDFRVSYDATLVEEAVLRAEGTLPPEEHRQFRAERDRIYEGDEDDGREARFEELHGRWFIRLGLDRPLHEALAERPALLRRTGGCRVARVVRRVEELADLLVDRGEPSRPPSILVRLRPESLLEPERLTPFLRRELMHVADMLDPRFGYQRDLPASEAGPSYDNLLRERYRVVWDTSIDGRLARRGWATSDAREARRAEFARTFPMLGEAVEEAFARWFDEAEPTHDAIAAFARDPSASRCAYGSASQTAAASNQPTVTPSSQGQIRRSDAGARGPTSAVSSRRGGGRGSAAPRTPGHR